MSVNIQVRGIASTAAFLKAASKETLVRANKAIVKAGFWVQKEVKASIAGDRAEPKSWDTGFFINSILPIFPKPLQANIGCNAYPVEYAKHLEYGTSRMRPRRHFTNTAKRNEKKVSDFIEAEIKKVG